MKTRILNSIRRPVFALLLMGLMALAVWRAFGQGEGVAKRLPGEGGKLSVYEELDKTEHNGPKLQCDREEPCKIEHY